MTVYVWPTRFFLPESFATPEIIARTVTGGASESGVRQVGRTDGGGLWKLDLSGVFLGDADLLQAWDAWHGILDNGSTAVIVPKSMGARAPSPTGVAVPEQFVASPFPIAVSDYVPVGPIAATLHGAVAERATQVTIRVTKGRQLRGGEHFGVEGTAFSWRRYKVAEVVSVTPASGYVDHVVNIRTPAREAYADTTAVDFNGPASVMQAAKMTLPEDLRCGKVDITFIESFGPYS